jgi:hypothetical protein
LRKFGELVVTDIEYGGSNDTLRGRYRKLYRKTLKIKGALLRASLDKYVYGNHFTSIYKPFLRFLKCPQCQLLTNIKHVEYKFDLKKLTFRYTCKRCRKAVDGIVIDRKNVAPEKIHIIRWDPKQMDVEYNPITGESLYYFNIPQEIKDKVRAGSKHLINSMPFEWLQNIRDNKLFRFEKNAIFHMKVAAPSGIDQQWGFPPLASTLKLFLYTMVLRKANEAIALEHIVPMRILHPVQNGATASDPGMMLNLQRWQEETKQNIRRWRRDPLHVMFAPVPLGVATMGGDGRAMLTLGETQEADKAIMAALGVPVEFLYGGLTKAGMEATLRLIENQTQNDADDMNDLLQWYTDQLSNYLGWENIDTELVPLKMVDDTETKQTIISLATGPVPIVSLTTMADRLGLDLDKERKKRKQEAIDEAKFKQELETELQKMQNTLAQRVQQEVGGAAGLNYDQQAVIAQADQIVSQLMGVDPNTRKSQLHSLQTEDMVMYSVVIQRLEEQQTQQTAQLRAQAQGGGQPPQQ